MGRLDLHQHGSELRDRCASFSSPLPASSTPSSSRRCAYKWRQWVIYPANWKTALEASWSPITSRAPTRSCLKYGQFYAYSKPYGLHGVSGFDERDKSMKMSQSSSVTRVGEGADPRVSTYELRARTTRR